MASQQRIQKPAPQEKVAEPQAQPVVTESELAEDALDWLDEIDAVLEENAEEFVKAYIQKGGE